MKVKATRVGFYGKLRKVGEGFEIKSKKDLGSWMAPLSKPKNKVKESENDSEI